MRFTHLLLLLGLCTAPATAQGQVPAPSEEATEVEGVTVTAPRPAPVIDKPAPPDPEPLGVFRDFCFDPNRLKGRSARPVGDPRWRALDADSRARLRVPPSTLAYLFVDPALQTSLLLRIEEQASPLRLRRGLVEHRCSVTVSGGSAPQEYRRGLAALFQGAGSENHIEHHAARGYEKIPGWRQRIWSMTPPRGYTRWRTHNPDDGSFVALTGPNYFSRYDYVAGELKHNEDAARPVSILMLTHTFVPEPGRGASAPAPRNPVKR